MHSNSFKIATDPEHDRLSEYIEDNPDTAAPIVGLEYITEFVGDSDIRPFYHCCLPECCNEQGDSRQMFEHLITLDHVISWLQEQGIRHLKTAEDEDEEECIKVSWRLLMKGTTPYNQSYKSIEDKKLHRKCEQARLRFTKLQIESLRERKQTEPSSGNREDAVMSPGCEENVNEPAVESQPCNESIEANTESPSNQESSSTDVNDVSKESSQPPDRDPMCIIKQEVKQELKQEVQSPVKKIFTKPESLKKKHIEKVKTQSPSAKSVLSFQEYQNKKRAEEVQIVSEKIVKDMSLSNTRSQVKTELVAGQESRSSVDLLSRGSESPAVSKPAPKRRTFQERVAKYIVNILQKHYYAMDTDTEEQRAKKTIKIRDKDEFQVIGKSFGKQFEQDIRDAYEQARGDLEGLDDVDVAQYGIEHEIHKFFEEKPLVKH